MTVIHGVFCLERACDKQMWDTFQASRLIGVEYGRLWRCRHCAAIYDHQIGHEITCDLICSICRSVGVMNDWLIDSILRRSLGPHFRSAVCFACTARRSVSLLELWSAYRPRKAGDCADGSVLGHGGNCAILCNCVMNRHKRRASPLRPIRNTSSASSATCWRISLISARNAFMRWKKTSTTVVQKFVLFHIQLSSLPLISFCSVWSAISAHNFTPL